MDLHKFCVVFIFVLTTVALVSCPVFGLINALKKRDYKIPLQGCSAFVGFLGFLGLAGGAIFSHPNLGVKIVFCVIFGAGNGVLWPYLIGKLASARGQIAFYWFALTLFPVGYMWFLIYLFNFSFVK